MQLNGLLHGFLQRFSMVLSVGDEYEGEVFGSQSFVYLLLFFQKQEGVLEPATYIGAEGGSQVSLQIVQIENNILGILSEIGEDDAGSSKVDQSDLTDVFISMQDKVLNFLTKLGRFVRERYPLPSWTGRCPEERPH